MVFYGAKRDDFSPHKYDGNTNGSFKTMSSVQTSWLILLGEELLTSNREASVNTLSQLWLSSTKEKCDSSKFKASQWGPREVPWELEGRKRELWASRWKSALGETTSTHLTSVIILSQFLRLLLTRRNLETLPSTSNRADGWTGIWCGGWWFIDWPCLPLPGVI